MSDPLNEGLKSSTTKSCLTNLKNMKRIDMDKVLKSWSLSITYKLETDLRKKKSKTLFNQKLPLKNLRLKTRYFIIADNFFLHRKSLISNFVVIEPLARSRCKKHQPCNRSSSLRLFQYRI